MKIGLVSLHWDGSKKNKLSKANFKKLGISSKLNTIKKILEKHKENNIDFYAFSGSSLSEYKELKELEKYIANNKINSSLIVEVGLGLNSSKNDKQGYYLISNSEIQEKFLIKEVFSTSGEAKEKSNISQLFQEIESGKRTINLNEIKIGILVCGEIFMYIAENHSNVKFRNGEIDLSNKFNIIVNASHYPFGGRISTIKKYHEFQSKNFKIPSLFVTGFETKGNKVENLCFGYNQNKMLKFENIDERNNENNYILSIINLKNE
ncbi:MAG: hypothetical protein LAT82_04270 [Nanoarchaeota archaeon]|nr:hypothetical protein [Nanoarchaeota archaeon]